MLITEIHLPSQNLGEWFNRDVLKKWEDVAIWFAQYEDKVIFQHISPKGLKIYSSENSIEPFKLVSRATLFMGKLITGYSHISAYNMVQSADAAESETRCCFNTAFNIQKKGSRQLELIDIEIKEENIPQEFKTGEFLIKNQMVLGIGELQKCLKLS